MKLRFAPSPTGLLHLGNTRTALINWLFARSHGGQFILRVDDTDLVRSKSEYAQQICEDMAWLGLAYDDFFRQSDRLDRYEAAAESLKKSGRLYPCYETKEELDLQKKIQISSGRPPLYNRAALALTDEDHATFEKKGIKPHWRFKMNAGDIHWNDLVRGPVTFQGEHLNDPVLIREDGSPVYILASVVDDIESGVTHIIRGEDHVTNTAVQIQILEALTGQKNTIEFAHLALISGKQGEGFSKREGSLSLKELRAEGLNPMAIHSLLAKLGTSDPIEPYTSLQEIINSFDIKKFGRSTPKLDPEDLWQMNEKILHLLPLEAVQDQLEIMGAHGVTSFFWQHIQKNARLLSDVYEWWKICYEDHKFPVDEKELMEIAEEVLPPEPWTVETMKQWTTALSLKTDLKGKSLFKPLRRALTGREDGPELKDLLLILGRSTVIKRLQDARK